MPNTSFFSCPENPFHDDVDDFNRYWMGTLPIRYDPSEEKYKNMLRLVAYDISNPKRLQKVAKACEDFGIRVEYSVFECDLDDKDFERLWCRLLDVIDEDEDRVLIYRICSSCVSKIEAIGTVSRPGKTLLYIL
jgi:CRISPR-associated protein Cas2